jgi:hypothetical protein
MDPSGSSGGFIKTMKCLKWLIVLLPPLFGFWAFHHYEFQTHFRFMQGERGDNRAFIFILEHWFRAFQGKESLASPLYYYPVRGTLGYNEALAALVPFYNILRAFFDMYTSTQLAVIIGNILNFIICFWLFRTGFGLQPIPSSVGAAFYSFNSAKYNQIGHINFQVLFLLPLILLCVVGCVKHAGKDCNLRMFVKMAAAGMFLAVQMATSFYFGWFLAFWSLLFILSGCGFAIFRQFLKNFMGQYHRAVIVALLFVLLCLAPVAALYLPALHENGPRSYQAVFNGLPEFSSFLRMGSSNHLWGWISRAIPTQGIPEAGEKHVGLGMVFTLFWIIVSLICLLDVWKTFRRKKPSFFIWICKGDERVALLCLMTVLSVDLFYLLAFKINSFSLWRLVYPLVPGSQVIRNVSRFVLFVVLPMSFIFSITLQRVLEMGNQFMVKKRKAAFLGIVAGILMLLFWEQTGEKPESYFDKSKDFIRIQEMARNIPPDATAFFIRVDPRLPGGWPEFQVDAMLTAAMTGIPTLNGYSSLVPKDWHLDLIFYDVYMKCVYQWIDNHQLGPKVYMLDLHR